MTEPLDDANLRALVSLLDDRDPGVALRCRLRVEYEGRRALPYLQEAAERGAPTLQLEAGEVLLHLRLQLADQDLLDAVADPVRPIDLEAAALLLARTHEPELTLEPVCARLDNLSDAIAARLPVNADDAAGIALVFASVIGAEYGLRGNETDYYDPRNSFVHLVLERKVGIPISLSAIYMFVARRLGLPLFGIGMPGHFIVRCGVGADAVYIDPFRRGRLLRRADCRTMLHRQGLADDDALLAELPDRNVLARMIANLATIHQRGRDPLRHARYRRLFEAVRGESGVV